MIARSWDGLTRAAQADAYAEYIQRHWIQGPARDDREPRRLPAAAARGRADALSRDVALGLDGRDPPLRRRRARARPLLPGRRALPDRARPERRALRGGERGRDAHGRRGRGRRARARARDARPRRHLARSGARRAPGRRLGGDRIGPADRLGAHDLGAGAARDGLERRVPAPSRRRGRGGAGGGGLPGAAGPDAPGLGPRRCKRSSSRTARSPHAWRGCPTQSSDGGYRGATSTPASRCGRRSATSCTTAGRSGCCGRSRCGRSGSGYERRGR